jgi:hypothetical protein
MSIFGFFRRNHLVLPQRTGLIGHWKRLDNGSNEDLRKLIEQLQDGDTVSFVFEEGDIYHASIAMFEMRHKFRIDTMTFSKIMRVIYNPDERKSDAPAGFAATMRLHKVSKPRRVSQQKCLFDRFHVYLVELHVVRGAKDQSSSLVSV